MTSAGASHGSGARSSGDRRTVMTFGNDSQAGELQLALPARAGQVEGVDDPLHETTPSDDLGSQAFVMGEAVTRSLAPSLSIHGSLSHNGGTGDRREQSRSPRRDDESRASGSSARTPMQRSAPGHPCHGMSLAPSARRLGAAPLASEAVVSTGSQPALNFDVEAGRQKVHGFHVRQTHCLLLKLFLCPSTAA